ncbi:hypothetical protein P153DRAFT_434934 [Dothidotthia symphoricarpi CBS 119687]|uniref:Uncharacterized protein n=1 Tax=Dothidotthia symphoricarpi CBS 119687 TaxID=1392245 RepID=A0A6A5ZYR2_9PLEO|nr:uncharacterized protein P153DRAFT_434934 [Dothidotthia symphoricarpi CBS 119687]KAF2124689.1 hypothetical protein P153DRAFT_434934 [Dothidotthia symphoricarpi CBS 119687]
MFVRVYHRLFYSTGMSDIDTELFDPIECASLHNQLVQRAVQANPSLQPSRDVLRLQSEDDPLIFRLSAHVRMFLTIINSWPVEADFTALTPFCQPPSSRSFFQYKAWPQFSAYEDELILLYQDVSVTMENEGGLFFDQEREVACWIDPSLGFPPEDSWFPLAEILRRWLLMWDAGKIKSDRDLSMQEWGEWELQQSLNAWDELITAIEERMPAGENEHEKSSIALVQNSVVDQWANHSFERAFLAQARAPKKPGMNIAPGVRAWTTQSFEASHANEASNCERKLTIGNKPDDGPFRQCHHDRDLAPVLLFPGAATVPKPVSPRVDNFWGRGSVLLARTTGLYLYPDKDWGDAVLFVDGKGGDTLFTYQNGWCPWMRTRPLATLREVLTFWKFLVADEVWQVDANGVLGGIDYFNNLKGSKRVVDLNGVQTEIDLRANWSVAPAF